MPCLAKFSAYRDLRRMQQPMPWVNCLKCGTIARDRRISGTTISEGEYPIMGQGLRKPLTN